MPRSVFRQESPLMVSKYYDPGEQRSAKVRDLFDTIAPRYDLINDLQSFGLHRFWKRQLVRAAKPRAGEAVLDLCCGTGDVAFAFFRRGLRVAGLDFSQPMLSLAEKRAVAKRARPLPTPSRASIAFGRGDAQQLPFLSDSFDIVTVSYGLRNLADWKRGLEEMHRVTRPGGRFLVLDFGKPQHPLWRRIYFGYLRHVIPIFGQCFCGDRETYSYILESLEHYPSQDTIGGHLRTMPCRNVKVLNLLGGIMSIHYAEKGAAARG